MKLVENRSRAARFADWSLSHCSNRHNHNRVGIKEDTNPMPYGAATTGGSVCPAGQAMVTFYPRNSRNIAPYMPEAIKR